MSNAQPIQAFSATVRKIDINPYVQVPDGIVRKLQQDAKKVKGPIPVKGTLQGESFSATVVRFRGMWRLYLNTAMRHAASVEVGDKVRMGVRFDNTPRTVPAPRKFTLALSKNKRAKEAFQKLAPSRQKEILRYLNGLKRPETLERNIEKVIQFLQGEKVQGLVAVTRAR
ncbi:MAG TPA: YdeI/OmpD-associated family protein [Anaerolineae bacterium]|nr:YdeI/OmpD-associated family protein [Anaerolineae bacterium]